MLGVDIKAHSLLRLNSNTCTRLRIQLISWDREAAPYVCRIWYKTLRDGWKPIISLRSWSKSNAFLGMNANTHWSLELNSKTTREIHSHQFPEIRKQTQLIPRIECKDIPVPRIKFKDLPEGWKVINFLWSGSKPNSFQGLNVKTYSSPGLNSKTCLRGGKRLISWDQKANPTSSKD